MMKRTKYANYMLEYFTKIVNGSSNYSRAADALRGLAVVEEALIDLGKDGYCEITTDDNGKRIALKIAVDSTIEDPAYLSEVVGHETAHAVAWSIFGDSDHGKGFDQVSTWLDAYVNDATRYAMLRAKGEL